MRKVRGQWHILRLPTSSLRDALLNCIFHPTDALRCFPSRIFGDIMAGHDTSLRPFVCMDTIATNTFEYLYRYH